MTFSSLIDYNLTRFRKFFGVCQCQCKKCLIVPVEKVPTQDRD
jgi:hypothetical protein